MKKIILLILALLLVLLIGSVAMAADGAPPEAFFTWAALATYAGATALTCGITQLLKGVSVIGKIPTRLFAYIIAIIVLIAATYFTGTLTIESAALCLVNGVVVALASSGAYDTAKQIAGTAETHDK